MSALMAEAIVEFVFWLLKVMIAGTGSVILSLFSLDSRHGDEDLDSAEVKSELAIFSVLDFWVGAAFWIAAFCLLYWLLKV